MQAIGAEIFYSCRRVPSLLIKTMFTALGHDVTVGTSTWPGFHVWGVLTAKHASSAKNSDWRYIAVSNSLKPPRRYNCNRSLVSHRVTILSNLSSWITASSSIVRHCRELPPSGGVGDDTLFKLGDTTGTSGD